MAANERTALLHRHESQDDFSQHTALGGDDLSTEYDSHDEDAEDPEYEEPVDMLVDRYAGAQMTAPSLSGSMGVFGTSLKRRSSTITFSYDGLHRIPSHTETIRHRPSKPSMALNGPGPSRQPSCKSLNGKVALHNHHAASDDVEDGSVVREGKYLVEMGEFQFWSLFLSIFLTWLVACFDSTLMASSHPVISTYFDASNEASWFSTSFLLTSSSFSPMFARFSDTFGRRVTMLFGLWTFAIGTVWCAIAPTILHFILARALCGLGVGACISLGAIIMGDLLPLHRRSSYMSWLNLSYGIGSSLGAALGGFLAETIGWRWEFGMQVPAILLAVLVAWLAVPFNLGPELAKNNPKPLLETIKSFDLLGSFLLATSTMALILCLNMGGNTIPWTHPLIPTFLGLFLVLGSAFIYVESRTANPVLPLRMLFHIPRGNLVFSNFLNCMSMNTILFNVPLYFQATLLDSPTRSGTRLIIPFTTNMFAAFITGHLISYTGRIKPTLVFGYALILIGLICLSVMSDGLPTYVYSWIVAIPMNGQGFGFPTVFMAQLAVSSSEDMAVAIATLMLFRNLGTVMGVAVSSLVSQNALVYYLVRLVDGPEKEAIIAEVRKAVESVKDLAPMYQKQVIQAYSAALHVTFIQGTVTAAIAFALVVAIKLPRLTEKSKLEHSATAAAAE